ncbi:uncharacterized protein PgNI_08563 [Pyricularia grisea]|uniref:Uncharacterized protein n=1 Tax=Pyricularia grisea TaxID=148305 RepID=A0A6P8AW28_PYRGI|nr:uncharacterized protein PgNI_08563 [Pyricularia grisea]TLD06397.1 hypothetical protein PgNI_08563 [Pyricularia grisea]
MVPLNSCSYAVLSVEEQLNRATNVAKTIEDMLEHIVMSTTEDAFFGTKKNALETLKRYLRLLASAEGIPRMKCAKSAVVGVAGCSTFSTFVRRTSYMNSPSMNGCVVELATDLDILNELQEGLDILEGNDDEDEDMGDDADDYTDD